MIFACAISRYFSMWLNCMKVGFLVMKTGVHESASLQFWGLWKGRRLIVFVDELFNGIHNSSLRRTSHNEVRIFLRGANRDANLKLEDLNK
jgi:hypothetical protein